MLDTSSQFLSSEQPSEPKSLDAALNILQELKKYARKTCDCGQPEATGGHSSFERKRAPVTVEICVLFGQ